MYSNSRNDIPRVAQRYGTIAAHTRRRASVNMPVFEKGGSNEIRVASLKVYPFMLNIAADFILNSGSEPSDLALVPNATIALNKILSVYIPSVYIFISGCDPTGLVGAGTYCKYSPKYIHISGQDPTDLVLVPDEITDLNTFIFHAVIS